MVNEEGVFYLIKDPINKGFRSNNLRTLSNATVARAIMEWLLDDHTESVRQEIRLKKKLFIRRLKDGSTIEYSFNKKLGIVERHNSKTKKRKRSQK